MAADGERTSCTLCSCGTFVGQPITETVFSDKLLTLLLKAKRPEEYAERVQVGPDWRRVDLEAIANLPGGHKIIERLARGEHPTVVFATLAEQGIKDLPMLPSGATLGGPGARTATTTTTAEGSATRPEPARRESRDADIRGQDGASGGEDAR
jgi:hypothetical protein